MTLSSSSPLDSLEDQPTIGFLCPLYTELAAVIATFDEDFGSEEKEDVEYFYGRICSRTAVAVQFPFDEVGPAVAQEYASHLLEAHPSLRHQSAVCLLVGTAGGSWDANNDIRLGDVVIATKIWDRSHGTDTQPEHISRQLRQKLPRFLHSKERLGNLISQQLTVMQSRQGAEVGGEQHDWLYPDFVSDELYEDDYEHVSGTSCASCDSTKRVTRTARGPNLPRVHSGTIASALGSQSTHERLRLLRAQNVLAIDAESCGLAEFTFFTIRGISDYSDSHKNDRWQPYAAATAAACARLLVDFLVKPPQRQKTSASVSVQQDVSISPSVVPDTSSLSPSPKLSAKGKQVMRKQLPEASTTSSAMVLPKEGGTSFSELPGYSSGPFGSSLTGLEKKHSVPQSEDYHFDWRTSPRPPSPTESSAPPEPVGAGPGAPSSVVSYPASSAGDDSNSAFQDYPSITAWMSRMQSMKESQNLLRPIPAQGVSGSSTPAYTSHTATGSSDLAHATSKLSLRPPDYPETLSTTSGGWARPSNSNPSFSIPTTQYSHLPQQIGSVNPSVVGSHVSPYEAHVPQQAKEFKTEYTTTVESVRYKGVEQGSGTQNTQGPLYLCEVMLGYEAVEPWYESLRFLHLRQSSGYGQAKIWLPIDQIEVNHVGKTVSLKYHPPKNTSRQASDPDVEIVLEFASAIPVSTFVKVLLLQDGMSPLCKSTYVSNTWTVGSVRGQSVTDTFSPYGISNFLHLWTSGRTFGSSRYDLTALGDKLDFFVQDPNSSRPYLEMSPLYCLDYTSTIDKPTDAFNKELGTEKLSGGTTLCLATFGNFLDDGRSKCKILPTRPMDIGRLLDCALPYEARRAAYGGYWYMVAYLDAVTFSFPKTSLKAEATSEAHLSLWKVADRLLFQLRSISKQPGIENPFRWKTWEIVVEPEEPSKRMPDTSWIPGTSKSSRKQFKVSDWRKKVTFEQHQMYVGDHISLKRDDNMHARMEDGSVSREERTWTIQFEDKTEGTYKKLKSFLFIEPAPKAQLAMQGADAAFMKDPNKKADYTSIQNPGYYPGYTKKGDPGSIWARDDSDTTNPYSPVPVRRMELD